MPALRPAVLSLALAAAALPGAARAEPLPMVMLVNPPRMHPVSVGLIAGAGLATSFDGRDASGLSGGGLAASFHVFGPYGEFRVWFAVDVRARVLADLGAPGGAATTLPVDVLARTTLVTGYRFHEVECAEATDPSALCLGVAREVPEPLQPYVGIGGTVAFPLSAGDVRGGLVTTLGLAWYVDERLPLFAELEGRALFGAPNVLGQLGLNVGFLFGP